MTAVEITAEEARAILAAPWHLGKMTTEASNALHALGRRLEEAEEAEREHLARSLTDQFLESWHAGVARSQAARAAELGPKWEYLARAVKVIERTVSDDPAATAKTDRLAAYLRERLDALGLSILDADTLYVLLVGAGLMVEMSANGRRSDPELVGPEVVGSIAAIAQTMTAALIPYLPDEAKR